MLRTLQIAAVLSTLWAVSAHATTCSTDVVAIQGDWGQTFFRVEIADEPHEQAKGLMHRVHLDQDAGMLFVFPDPVHALFWMKDTLISLDMIFVDASGTITHIHPNTVPNNPSVIDGGKGVSAVLEVNAGLTSRLSIAPGDTLLHPAFGADAVWPCQAADPAG